MNECEVCYEPKGNTHICRTSEVKGDVIHRTWIVNGEHRFVINKAYHSIEWQNETEEGVVLVIKPREAE